MFYFLALFIILIAAAVVFLSFKTKPLDAAALNDARIKRYVEIFRSREKKLALELDQDLIDEQDFQQLYAEQARELIQQVEQISQQTQAGTKSNKAWYLSVLVLPIMAVVIYNKLGAYQDWQIAQQLKNLTAVSSAADYKTQLNYVADEITQRLKQRPDAIEYRLLLAQLAMSDSDFQTALSHYSVVAELLPEDAQAQAYYAQALYLASDRQLTASVAQAMDNTLQLDPLQPTVLGMQGIIAFELADYSLAIEAWQKLLAVIDVNSSRGEMIQRGIAEAKSKLDEGQDGQPEREASRQGLNDNAVDSNRAQDTDMPVNGISVKVNINDALKSQFSPDTLVYVYAKAAEGPPMPLAVQRLPLASFPRTVKLDDSTAMMADFTLNQFDQVIVGARISLTGNAIKQKGDVDQETEAFNWRENKQQSIELP